MRFKRWGRLAILAFSCAAALPARAVRLESTIYDITPPQNFISWPILNDSSRANLYTIAVWKIDRPGAGGERRVDGSELEVVYSPLRLTLQPGRRDYFKLYYRGPQDERERYYRVQFKETPVTLIPWREQRQGLDAVPVVSVSAILVVRPRKMTFRYELDEATGMLKNSGNTWFRVIVQQGCQGDDESATQLALLPGDVWRNSAINARNRKYIVALGRYHRLGQGCFAGLPPR